VGATTTLSVEEVAAANELMSASDNLHADLELMDVWMVSPAGREAQWEQLRALIVRGLELADLQAGVPAEFAGV
jgi:hypothetical protein